MAETDRENEFRQLEADLQKKFPLLIFEVLDDDEAPEGLYIAVLSTGPDYGPDLRLDLPGALEFFWLELPRSTQQYGIYQETHFLGGFHEN